MPVTPHQLDGADREQAWQRIAAAQPRQSLPAPAACTSTFPNSRAAALPSISRRPELSWK
jgi:hypothetical protein